MNRLLFQILLTGILLGRAFSGGQTHPDTLLSSAAGDSIIASSPSNGFLSVETSPPGATLIVDTISLGNTPVHGVSLTEGAHVVRASRGGESWFQPTVTETVLIRRNEMTLRRIVLPNVYRIMSEPFGAEVYLHDSLAGVTPLLLTLYGAGSMIRIAKTGYTDETVPVPSAPGEVRVALQPLPGLGPEGFLAVEQHTNSVPIYVTTGMTVITGVAAAYFKIKADASYGDYQANGDGVALDRTHRYDRAAGITLAVSQASFLLLTYLLLSR